VQRAQEIIKSLVLAELDDDIARGLGDVDARRVDADDGAGSLSECSAQGAPSGRRLGHDDPDSPLRHLTSCVISLTLTVTGRHCGRDSGLLRDCEHACRGMTAAFVVRMRLLYREQVRVPKIAVERARFWLG
jgi:hypothetical protein